MNKNPLDEAPPKDYFLPEIKELYAFLTMDKKHGEGLVCSHDRLGRITPLMATDAIRISEITPLAVNFAKEHKTIVKLVKFSNREEISVIGK